MVEITANEHEELKLRLDAVVKVLDQKLLTEIIKSLKNHKVRTVAMKNTEDQNVLVLIVQNKHKNWKVRINALQRLSELDIKGWQEVIFNIAKTDGDAYSLRMSAIKNIRTLEALKDYQSLKKT